MSLRFALEGLPPAMRAQAEAKLRQGATIRGKSEEIANWPEKDRPLSEEELQYLPEGEA